MQRVSGKRRRGQAGARRGEAVRQALLPLALAAIVALACTLGVTGCGAAPAASGDDGAPADQAAAAGDKGQGDAQADDPNQPAADTTPVALEDFDIVGRWQIWSVETAGGEAYHIDRAEEAAGLAYGDLQGEYLFAQDGAVTAVIDDGYYNGSYVRDGGTVTMTFESGTPIALTFDTQTGMVYYADGATDSRTYLKKEEAGAGW